MKDNLYIQEDIITCNLPEGIKIHKINTSYYGLFSNKKFKKGDIIGESGCVILPADYFIHKIKILHSNNKIELYNYNEHNFTLDVLKNIKKYWGFDCFMNHSCCPNVKEIFRPIEKNKDGYFIQLFQIIAINDIECGDEITCNYLHFDFDLNLHFDCNCGHINCYKIIKGFKYLNNQQKQEIIPKLDPIIYTEFQLNSLYK